MLLISALITSRGLAQELFAGQRRGVIIHILSGIYIIVYLIHLSKNSLLTVSKSNSHSNNTTTPNEKVTEEAPDSKVCYEVSYYSIRFFYDCLFLTICFNYLFGIIWFYLLDIINYQPLLGYSIDEIKNRIEYLQESLNALNPSLLGSE
uniref:Uncharacterized protein n=1 Tax=viral metagenome TaxID=1070528 RepID=A0A6C0CYH0_9ZZZZ